MPDDDAAAELSDTEATALEDALETPSEAPLDHGRPTIAEFLAGATGAEGALVYDEPTMRESPCIGLALAEGEDVDAIVVDGALGPLSDDQIATYCNAPIRVIEVSASERERWQAFSDASHVCKDDVAELPKGEKFGPYTACMSRELKAHGHRL